MATATTERIIDVDQPRLSQGASKRKPINKDSIFAITKDTDYMVTGTFLNIECPGQPMKIPVKLYKDMQYFCKTLEDGVTYTIPWSVSRHINEEIYSMTHGYLLDANGLPAKSQKKIHRCKFIVGG